MTSDEFLWGPASLFEQSWLDEEAHTRLVLSIEINQQVRLNKFTSKDCT